MRQLDQHQDIFRPVEGVDYGADIMLRHTSQQTSCLVGGAVDEGSRWMRDVAGDKCCEGEG